MSEDHANAERARKRIAEVMQGILARYAPPASRTPAPPPAAKTPPKPHSDGHDIFGDDSEPGSEG